MAGLVSAAVCSEAAARPGGVSNPPASRLSLLALPLGSSCRAGVRRERPDTACFSPWQDSPEATEPGPGPPSWASSAPPLSGLLCVGSDPLQLGQGSLTQPGYVSQKHG